MRIVMVNHCHPDMPHVCAVRARAFADALARRGHDVVLLTESLGHGDGDTAETLAARIEATFDGKSRKNTPLSVAVRPRDGTTIARARTGRLGPAGKVVLAWHYLTTGEVYEDWTGAAKPLLPVLAQRFRPDVVWASFGNTGVLKIAQGIAAAAGVPWVMDMKDPWNRFVPTPLERIVAKRFQDARAFTALSAGHAGEVDRWFGRTASVVYSGIPDTVADVPPARPPLAPPGVRIVLSGSLYDESHLRILADGLRLWQTAPDDRRPVHLDYYGNEGGRLHAALTGLPASVRITTYGRVPLETLMAAQASAHANAFIASPAALFHHKIFELATAGRPIVAVPDVSAEERALLARLGARLHVGTTADAVAKTMATIGDAEMTLTPPATAIIKAFTWDAQAAQLEAALAEASA